jgi:hypothetical protein
LQSNSSILFIYLERSRIIPSPNSLPVLLVPPPLAVMGIPFCAPYFTTLTTSILFLGRTMAKGLTRYRQDPLLYMALLISSWRTSPSTDSFNSSNVLKGWGRSWIWWNIMILIRIFFEGMQDNAKTSETWYAWNPVPRFAGWSFGE